MERIREGDAADPEGAGDREAARRLVALEDEMLHRTRVTATNTVIEAAARAVAGEQFAQVAEETRRRWTDDSRRWADQQREAGASSGSGDTWQEQGHE